MPDSFKEKRSQLQPIFDLEPLLEKQKTLMGNVATNAANTGKNLDGATTKFKAGIESSEKTLSEAPGHGIKLADQALLVSQRGEKFRSDIEKSKMNVEVVVKMFEDIGIAMNRASENVIIAMQKVPAVFQGVVSAGVQLDASVSKSGDRFLEKTTKATDILVRGMQSVIKDLTQSQRGLATEKTLSNVVSQLQLLNRKLPQPVLI